YRFNADRLSTQTEMLVRNFLKVTVPNVVEGHDLVAMQSMFATPIMVAEGVLRDFGAPDKVIDNAGDPPMKNATFALRLNLIRKLLSGDAYASLAEVNRLRNIVVHEAGAVGEDVRLQSRLSAAGGTLHRYKLLITGLIDVLSKNEQLVWNIFQEAGGRPRSQRPAPDRTPPIDLREASTPDRASPSAVTAPPRDVSSIGGSTPVEIREGVTPTARRIHEAIRAAEAREQRSAEHKTSNDGHRDTPPDSRKRQMQSQVLYENGPVWDAARETIIASRDATYSVLARRLSDGAGTISVGIYDSIEVTEIGDDKIATITVRQLQIIRAGKAWQHILTMILDRQNARAPIPKWISVSPDLSQDDAPLRLHLHLSQMTRQMAAGIRDRDDSSGESGVEPVRVG
ncbi:MAG: hypothetical protein ACP5RC_09520, partial [Halothiobacillaceae bacterium]